MAKEIIIKPQFNLQDYFKVNLFLFFRKFIFLVVILLLCGLIGIVSLFILPSNEAFLAFKPLYIILVLFPALMIFATYRVTKKSLQNPKLKENIRMSFTSEYFEETGETFTVKYFWTEIYKIEEGKNWFLIFLAKNRVKVILKADLDEVQYTDLKAIFSSLPIKKRLK